MLNGPYIVDKPEQFTKLLNSPWYADVDQRLQKAGFRVLSMGGFFGNRHMIADKPIKSPTDLSGVTVRVPPNQMWLETFKALGARPATVQWSEIYNALQQGVVQAAEAPFGSIWGAKLQEVKKVISLTGHFTAIVAWPMNEGYFSKLPKEVQEVLLSEGARARDEMTRLTLAMEDDYIGKLKAAGVTIVADVDRPAFKKATVPVYSAFPKWTPGLHDKVEAILAQG